MRLNEEKITRQTSGQSFKRGKTYYRRGYLFNLSVRDNELTGSCIGSSRGPYRVTAQLGPSDDGHDPIRQVACSCLAGGLCKHIVALTLAWAHEPSRVPEAPLLKELLANKSEDDVIELIGLMILRFPEIGDLVEVPLTTVSDDGTAPVEAESMRHQLDVAVKGAFARGTTKRDR